MKKLFSILLVVMMLAALAIPAFAEDATQNPPAPTTGTITINGITVSDGENNAPTYEIYLLLDLESYDASKNAYSYKVNADWAGFFADGTGALDYVAIDPESGYVTWIAAESDETYATFAKLALAYAKENGISSVQSSDNEGEFVITDIDQGKKAGTFSNLDFGWYLVDSTVGALCGLTTTNPEAQINAKNSSPTIDKQVMEDSTQQWADNNTADIGQTINFRITVNVHAGAEDFILHDVMSEGLTFADNVKVELVRNGVKADVDASNYTVKTCAGHTDETTDDTTDGCTVEIHFTKLFCDSLDDNDKLIIYYDAVLNENAIVAGDGNTNTAHLEYGEEHETTEDVTVTYTFGFDIVKTDNQNALLDGAEFKIYDAATDGTEIPVVHIDEEHPELGYRRAKAGEVGETIVVTGGKVRIDGFDNGTYYLEETKAPSGYNKLTARQKFIISDANLDATINNGIFSTGSGVHVVNKTGSMLPETGGLGTTLFIVVGGITVLGAGILLFAKKRMSQIAE